MDDFELPPLPTGPPFRRKRTRSITSLDPATSSDPALFSSDEQAPSAEDYACKRRKKQYPGTWWGERLRKNNAGEHSERQFRRNFDSGIFMGSEGSSFGSSSGLEDELIEDQRKKQEENGDEDEDSFDWMTRLRRRGSKKETGKLPKPKLVSPQEQRVRSIMNKCLEYGREDVDFSYVVARPRILDFY